jgi:phosphoheptose isomerase
MMDPEGSEYDRLFYPYLFKGGKASAGEVLLQVQHSTLEKCREVIALRRATLEHLGKQIIDAGKAMAQAFAAGATLLAFEQAKKQGLLTIGLTGYDGGKMARSAALDFASSLQAITSPASRRRRPQPITPCWKSC